MSQEANFTDASSSSQEAYAIMGSTDMLQAIVLMSVISEEARRVGLAGIGAPLRILLKRLEGDLSALAKRTVQIADHAIVTKLRETQVRPETTKSLHLQDLIVSMPFPQGTVKIGLIDELDKATNPDGYGPYWRAQELGSVAVGNIMTGRVLFGRFEGPAHDDVPRSEFAGAHGAPGSEFHWGLSGESVESGLGTIEHEDQPRYFLQDGTAIAETSYQEGITGLSREYAGLIHGLAP